MSETPEETEVIRKLDLDLLQPGRFQPRRRFKELASLANSIKLDGLIQPLVVRPVAAGRFEIVCGERRWRACQAAGLPQVSCIIRNLSDLQAARVALKENIDRENLNPIEEALAIEQMMKTFRMNAREVGEAVGRSRPVVANLLRLLDLPDLVKDLVEDQSLEFTLAREICSAPRDSQVRLAQVCVSRKWTRSRLKQEIVRLKEGRASNEGQPKTEQALAMETEGRRLTDLSGYPTKVRHAGPGGEVVLTYTNLDEYEGIAEMIELATRARKQGFH